MVLECNKTIVHTVDVNSIHNPMVFENCLAGTVYKVFVVVVCLYVFVIDSVRIFSYSSLLTSHPFDDSLNFVYKLHLVFVI